MLLNFLLNTRVCFLIAEGVNAFLQMLLEVAPTAVAFDWFREVQFSKSMYSSLGCRIIPLWHCVNCIHLNNNPILNTDKSIIYPILQSSRLAQKKQIHKKKYILYKNIYYFITCYSSYIVQHAEKMLLLDNR